MIQQSFLEDMATYGASRLKNSIKVFSNNGTITVPATVFTEGNNVNVSFIVDNTVQGTLTEIMIEDTSGRPVETVPINYVKTLGTIFVGAFKFTYREGERT